MYMMVGHDDHWSFHDKTANTFNYYRYSDKFYSMLFDTNFEYQNRMVKSEWLPFFARAGLEVADYWGNVTDQTRADILALPHIDERFARHPFEELATVHSYFLLVPAGSHAARVSRDDMPLGEMAELGQDMTKRNHLGHA
jgi:hypothetical protein